MINITDSIDCAFNDYAESIINLRDNQEYQAIYTDMSEFSRLGLSNFENLAGNLLIHPNNKNDFKYKDKIQIVRINKTLIIEKIIQNADGTLKCELSQEYQEAYNGYSFDESS